MDDHFADVGKIIKAGAANKDIGDIKLIKYASYLIAQNGDSRKKAISLALPTPSKSAKQIEQEKNKKLNSHNTKKL